jgi:PAS domain S-box-containing protein
MSKLSKISEEELRESYSFYESMCQSIPFGMDIVDEEGNILFQNDILRNLYGPDAINKKCWELYRDDKKQCKECPLHKGIRIGETDTYETDGVLDGKIFDISHTGMIFHGKKAMLEIFQDITIRKQTDKALKESEFFFKESQRVASVGSYKTDFKSGLWNSSEILDTIFGIDENYPRTVEGWMNLIHPDDREMMGKHLRINIMQDGKRINKEYRITRQNDNELRWVCGISEATFNENGKIISLTGTIQDITDRKRIEEKLIESEAFYRTLIDISPDGIITCDKTGIITYASLRLYEILEETPGAIVGNSILNWIDTDYHEIIDQRIRDILSGSIRPHTREYKLLRHDRSFFWGELTSSPLKDKKNNPYGLLLVCKDITKRKKIEEDLIRARDKAEESDKLKTAFLHNISHEIRTPMNAIAGFSALLTEPGLDIKKQNSYVEVITNSSNHLLAIVTDLIEISNIEAGMVKFTSQKINVNSILNKLHSRFNPVATEKGITFKLDQMLPDDEAYIHSDSNKLTQILTNILSNAFKFTIKGQINFGYQKRKDFLEFYISDTGIGISTDQHERIFDRFYQIESDITRRYEGTGLGLAISKSYIEFMGGKIWLTSEPGKGSVFYFTMPYVESDQALLNYSDRQQNLYKDVRKSILIAEDEENNYLLMSELLSALDVNIIHATNGKEAVDICHSGKKINLVFMDIKMPVMDGHEATREIKKSFPDLPVIALTALSFESDMEKALNSGCNGYLSKPVKRNTLLETVSKYL